MTAPEASHFSLVTTFNGLFDEFYNSVLLLSIFYSVQDGCILLVLYKMEEFYLLFGLSVYQTTAIVNFKYSTDHLLSTGTHEGYRHNTVPTYLQPLYFPFPSVHVHTYSTTVCWLILSLSRLAQYIVTPPPPHPRGYLVMWGWVL
jgi:hypothetical protein